MKKLALGTVQFGTPYGISNTGGQTPSAEVKKIFAYAETLPRCLLDTAPAYGTSETLIGDFVSAASPLSIVTKVVGPAKSVSTQLDVSLQRMRRRSVYGVLVHHAGDLLGADGEALYAQLVAEKKAGRVKKIGCSVYTPEEAPALLKKFSLDLIQLPLSPFDQRALPHLNDIKSAGVEIYARSLFLQGALFLLPAELPRHQAGLREPLLSFREFAAEANLSLTEAAFAFVHAVPQVDVLLVGVNNLAQFQSLATTFLGTLPAIPLSEWKPFAVENPELVDPSKWKKAA